MNTSPQPKGTTVEITNAAAARKYLALAPRESLIKIAAEGVESAAVIAGIQGRPLMQAEYLAASKTLRAAI